MKKVVIIGIILLVILAVGISAWLYYEEQENLRLDQEDFVLKENLSIEFGKKVKISDFIKTLNGTLLKDEEIDTEKLGKIEISTEFRNSKNRKRTKTFTIQVIDITPPKIFSGNSYTVKVGYQKKLTDVLLSGDDIDDNPLREIIGEYDLNTPGNYPLTYVVTDASGNQTKKEFVLYVKEKIEQNQIKEEKLELVDVLEHYKTETTKIGVDVSKWQGEIDWEKVKNAGVEFAMIRMGYQTDYDGDYVIDPYFEANIKGAKEVGLPVGIYFYSYAKNVEQAKEQAEWVIENLKGYKLDLPVAFDWESWSSFNGTGMSFYTINKAANTFLGKLEEAGYQGMLYSSKTYLEKIWYPTEYETWLAQYNNKATYQGEYSIWQMSSTGRVDGIKGNVDIDIMYLKKDS